MSKISMLIGKDTIPKAKRKLSLSKDQKMKIYLNKLVNTYIKVILNPDDLELQKKLPSLNKELVTQYNASTIIVRKMICSIIKDNGHTKENFKPKEVL